MTIILFYAMHDPFINLFLGWKPYLFQPDGIASGINAMYKLRPAKGRLYLFRPQKIVRYNSIPWLRHIAFFNLSFQDARFPGFYTPKALPLGLIKLPLRGAVEKNKS